MSEPPAGPLTALLTPFAEAIEQHRRLPPHQKTLAHASRAAALLSWCIYLAPVVFNDQIAGAVLRAPLHAPRETWIPLALWGSLTGLALLWLIVAFSAAKGRDPMAAFWSLPVMGGCAALLWWQAYPSDWGPLAAFLLKGFYYSALAANGARFWLAARFSRGGALRILIGIIKRKNAPLRAARRRSY